MEEDPIPLETSVKSLQGRVVRSIKGRAKVEVSYFRGSLKPDDLLDWISEMEKFFNWEELSDPRRVKFSCIKLRGHDALWWDNL